MDIIYSIEARDTIIYNMLYDYFGLNAKELQKEAIGNVKMLNDALKGTNVLYNDFKNTLIPSDGRKYCEQLFAFRLYPDDNKIYQDIAENIIPLFNKDSRCNILIGDLILYPYDFDTKKLLIKSLYSTIGKRLSKNWHSDYFLIYVNHIKQENIEIIDNFFKKKKYYVGTADLSFESAFKSYISIASVLTTYVKIGKNIFSADADVDFDKHSHTDNGPWDWAKYGYQIYGIQDSLFQTLLKYKIDTSIGTSLSSNDRKINTMIMTSQDNQDLPIGNIKIDDRKLDYLEKHQLTLFDKIEVTKNNLKKEIINKIQNQAFYNIKFMPEHNVVTFNVFLEFTNKYNIKIKLIIALKYDFELKEISLVTIC